MGCGMSGMLKKESNEEEEEDAKWVCRERKRVVKKVVKHRLAFSLAHSSYLHSLSSVSSALSSFLPSFHSPTPTPTPTPTPFTPCSVSVSLPHQFYAANWDFFNLEDSLPIPPNFDLEFNIENENENENGSRELVQGFKVVEDEFRRAYDCGLQLSRMLELPSQSQSHHPPLPIPIDNATRKWSFSSQSSSTKSLLSSTFNCTSSACTESRSDNKSLLSCSETSSILTHSTTHVTDGYWGMLSGSHSFTLGRLYAWEKKLCREVKTGIQTWKIYQQKCSQLQKKDLEGAALCPSKPLSEVTDLYYQIIVTIRHAESISKHIEKLRDQELQPQLIELLHGLMRTWKAMLDSHEIQKKIVYEIRSFCRPDHGKHCINSHRFATLQLESAIQNWCICFSNYIAAQKAYVKSLHGWLSKFVDAETKYFYKGSCSLPPIRFNGPTLMVICQSWLTSLERLPVKTVKIAMKSLTKDIQALWVQQCEEQEQKRKVDGLSKEMDKKILEVKRAEEKVIVPKYTARNNVKDQVEFLNEKNHLEKYMKMIEMEKERCLSSLQETHQVTLSKLQMGLASVFDSLTDFSRASVNIYSDLLTFSQNAKD